MFKFESASAPRHLIQELDGICQFVSQIAQGDTMLPGVPGDSGEDRFFVMPQGVVLGGPGGCEIRAYTPGLSRENLQVFVINNLVVFHGTAPLADLNTEAAARNPGAHAEFYRAVRLPQAVLGETLEADCLDDGAVQIRCQWDPTSEPVTETPSAAEPGRSIPPRIANRADAN